MSTGLSQRSLSEREEGSRKVAVLRRRPTGRAYLAATPALVMLVVTALLFAALRRPNVTDRYEQAGNNAMVNGDYPAARVCFERLLQEGGGDRDLYRQGLELANAKLSQLTQAAFERRTGASGNGK